MLTIVIAFIFTAFFAGVEIAYVSANKLLVELKRKRATGEGDLMTRFYSRPSEFLGTMLVGHNIALVTLTILLTDIISPRLEPFLPAELTRSLLTTFLITLLVLVFAEYVPKAFFRLYADSIISGLAYPIRFFQILLAPPTWLMTKASTFLLRVFFKTPHTTDESVFTRGDLEHLLLNSFTQNPEENKTGNEGFDTDLFANALQLRNVRVKQCMIPRPEIVHIDAADSLEKLRQTFKETNLSRIILIDNDLNNVLGYVHHQQMLTAVLDAHDNNDLDHEQSSLRALSMDIQFVPEVMRVFDLMNHFITTRASIACVVDEFGGTSGIITLEDILEQIFGDIADEHDQEAYVETQVNDHEFIFSGRLDISYLNDTYPSLDLPSSDTYHTLSGYLVAAIADIPQQGSIIERNGLRFIPELVTDTRIETVRVIRIDHNDKEH
jgi:putative hemolysin